MQPGTAAMSVAPPHWSTFWKAALVYQNVVTAPALFSIWTQGRA